MKTAALLTCRPDAAGWFYSEPGLRPDSLHLHLGLSVTKLRRSKFSCSPNMLKWSEKSCWGNKRAALRAAVCLLHQPTDEMHPECHLIWNPLSRHRRVGKRSASASERKQLLLHGRTDWSGSCKKRLTLNTSIYTHRRRKWLTRSACPTVCQQTYGASHLTVTWSLIGRRRAKRSECKVTESPRSGGKLGLRVCDLSPRGCFCGGHEYSKEVGGAGGVSGRRGGQSLCLKRSFTLDEEIPTNRCQN